MLERHEIIVALNSFGYWIILHGYFALGTYEPFGFIILKLQQPSPTNK